MNTNTDEIELKRAHITLMRSKPTAMYAGIMMMGKSEIVDNPNITAYTDGVNKIYGREFFNSPAVKTPAKKRGLVLHENLHVALKHVPRGKRMFKENPQLAGMAADFVVNDIIVNIKDTLANGEKLVELPDGGLYDPMFHNWAFPDVYEYLKKKCKNPKKPPEGDGRCKNPTGGDGTNPNPSGDGKQNNGKERVEVEVGGKTYTSDEILDEHDASGYEEATAEELKKVNDEIDKALREGGLLAGRLGANIPRVISDLLEPKVDWREALRDFVQSSIKGKDEYTWRKMNRRQMANDIYVPSVEDETIGEVVVAIDTSGSIGSQQLTEFATELASICATCSPERVRVLWWDTKVHGEQIFTDNYENIAHLLKPMGGGGTIAGCVSEYLLANKVNAECVVMFTDGYVESTVNWQISTPTLWLVTSRDGFVPPAGGKTVKIHKEY